MSDTSIYDNIQHQDKMEVINQQYEIEMINKVKAAGFIVSKDGNNWCALLGSNLVDGDVFFDKNYMGVIRKAFNFISYEKLEK